MLSVLDPLLGTFFELLKNKFLTWIASGGTKVDESRKLGVVVSGKFGYSGRLRAPAMHGVSSNKYVLVFEKKNFLDTTPTRGVVKVDFGEIHPTL